MRKQFLRSGALFVVCLTLNRQSLGTMSSNSGQNLSLSNMPGADQPSPKPLPDNHWYVSWFNNSEPGNPATCRAGTGTVSIPRQLCPGASVGPR